jgi:PAS domain S-box-containing protein
MVKFIKIVFIVAFFIIESGYAQKSKPVNSIIQKLDNVKVEFKQVNNPQRIEYNGSLKVTDNSRYNQKLLVKSKPFRYKKILLGYKYFHNPDSVFEKMERSKMPYVSPSIIQAFPPRYKDNAVVNVKYYDIEQGLSNSYIYDVYEDRNGMLWIATNGGGVNRFDGDHFVVVSEANGLANNMVKTISCDSKGYLWFGTINGLSVFNGKYIVNYTTEQGLTDNHITDILIDKKGKVWVATLNGGVNIIDNNKIHVFDESIVLPKRINALDQDDSGNIWIGSENGLFHVKDSLILHYTSKNGLVSNDVFSVNASDLQNIYVGTNSGLDIIKGDTIEHLGLEEGLLNGIRINEIVNGGSSGIFLGTNGAGLVRIVGNTLYGLNENQGLSNNEIQTIHKDRSNVYWMGTWGGGLNRYDGFSFMHFNKSHGLPTNIFPTIIEDDNNSLWLGSFSNGILKYQNGNFHNYFNIDELDDATIWSMVVDNRKKLWFATDAKGLWCYDGNKLSVYNKQNGFPENSIWSLLYDKKGRLWVGTSSNSVLLYDDSSWKQYNFTDKPIISLFEDSKGNIWVLTWGDGIYKIEGRDLIHFSGNEDFPSDKIYEMYEDSDGYLWFATSGDGIVIYNGDSFQTIRKADGLTSDIIYWIKEINDGNILIGSESGLTEMILKYGLNPQYPKTSFVVTEMDSITLEKRIKVDERRYSINTYGILEGFTGHDCIGSQHSVDVSSDGLVWIGTGNHLTRYNPNFKFRDNRPATVHLKKVQVSMKEMDWAKYISTKSNEEQKKYGVEFNSVDYLYRTPQGLKLSYNHNQITFEFVAVDWRNPQKLNYKYKLEGLSDLWSDPTQNSEAMFSNLEPGEYKLMVKVINSDLIWSDPLIYRFTIKTPWWKTIIFRLSIILSVVLFLVFYIRYRMANLRKQKRVLEKMVLERTQEILNQKEEILAQRDALNETNIQLERLSIVARETNNGVLIADYRGNIEWINEGYTNLLGYDLDSLRENQGINLFFIYKSKSTLEFFRKCKDERRHITFAATYERIDQIEIWLQTTITPIFQSDGELKQYVVIYSDITELKVAQNENIKHIKEITASIRYASRIQNSILPLDSLIDKSELDTFVVYKPKDIVGGDFYWFSQHNENYLAGVIDCTGHGVPGALMTVIAYSSMSKSVNHNSVKDPAKLLQAINKEVRQMLRKDASRENTSDDGLDMSLCYIKPKERKVIYAGAKQPLYHCWSNEVDEIKGDKQSIGYVDSDENFKYTNHVIDVRSNSVFYLSSDGYKDMPVNKDGQLLGKKNFRQLLSSMSLKTLDEQKDYLENIIKQSGGNHENYDDITILAFQLKE